MDKGRGMMDRKSSLPREARQGRGQAGDADYFIEKRKSSVSNPESRVKT